MGKRIIMAVTGASGARYAQRLLSLLLDGGCEVHFVASPTGLNLLAEELDLPDPTTEALLGRPPPDRLIVHAQDDLAAPISSGSVPIDAMVVCPCSSNTLANIAAGRADTLITRAAHVTLKEHRRLVLVSRESPLSPIEIENMLKLSRAGAVLCPACPGFYHRPKTIADLVDFVVARVLDQLGVEHNLATRYS